MRILRSCETEPSRSGWDALIERARGLVADGTRAVLGVVGPPGSGRGVFAEALHADLARLPPAGRDAGWVATLPMEGFRLPFAVLRHLGRRDDGRGAPDAYDVHGYLALLRRLAADRGETIFAPAFDACLGQAVAGSIVVPAHARLIIVESRYLFLDVEPWLSLRTVLDEVWFCEVAERSVPTAPGGSYIECGHHVDGAPVQASRADEDLARLVLAGRDLSDVVVSQALMRRVLARGRGAGS